MPVYAIIATGIASAKFDHVGATPQCTFDVSTWTLKMSDEAEHDEQQLRREVDDREEDVEARRLA